MQAQVDEQAVVPGPATDMRAAVVLVAVSLALVFTLQPGDNLRLVVARALGVAATIAFGWGLTSFPPDARGVWACLWLYEAVTVCADVLYDILTAINGEPPFPGVTDVLYLSTYVFAFEALRRLIRLLSPGRDREAWMDASIIAIAGASVVLSFIIGPVLLATERFDLTVVVSVAYPLLDIVILATLVRALAVPRVSNPALTLVAGSMSLFLGYDLAYNYLAVVGDWTEYRWMEVVWTAAILLLALASRAPGASAFRPVHTDTADRVTVGRALSVGLAVLIGPTLLLYAVWQNDILVARWLAPGGLLVVVLLVWRMYRLLRTVQSQAEQLSGQARTDALTDVANRRSWDFEMTRAVQRARSSGLPFTVAMLDIDQFKAFNDAFGHQAGDEMLVACARAWSAELSAEMTLARYGGEEFALLLPGRRADACTEVLERLRAQTPEGATVSIGAAQWLPTEAATDTVRRADSAMYEAKRSGRNRVVIDRAHVA